MKSKPVSHFGADALLLAHRIIFVGAHPDDIEFYCGAAIRLMTQKRISVSYIIATKGDHKLPGILGRWLKQIRTRDQQRAAQALGVNDTTLLDYPDGYLSDYVDEYALKISEIADRKRPDIVLGWDPNHTFNPHPDHQAAGRAVLDARLRCRVAFFGTTEPDLLIPVNSVMLKSKLKSIRCHSTESPWFYYFIQKMSVLRRLKQAGSMAGLSMAECFRLNAQSNPDSKSR